MSGCLFMAALGWTILERLSDPAEHELPRALLIGDSITLRYADIVKQALEGTVDIYVIPENGRDTRASSLRLDVWLEDGDWDVIHFNWGLHDLKRELHEGVVGSTEVVISEYKENLTKLVARLDRTGADLIFATSTPIRQAALPQRVPADVLLYNDAALAVMADQLVVINDLYAVVEAFDILSEPDGLHFQPEGVRLLAEEVVTAISRQLFEGS